MGQRRIRSLGGGHAGGFGFGFHFEEGAAVVFWHDFDELPDRVVPVFEEGAGTAGEEAVALH